VPLKFSKVLPFNVNKALEKKEIQNKNATKSFISVNISMWFEINAL
jgi:hypothetical protein